MEEVLARACEEATVLADEGLDGVLVENLGDTPFFPHRVPPETVAAMAVATREVVRCVEIPVGVNVLRNDAPAALAVAVAAGARFIRVNVHTGSMFTDQGLLQGRSHRTLRQRRAIGVPLPILADLMVKHATPPPGLTLESAARDSWYRGMADGLILTGKETGEPVDPREISEVRGALPADAKVWVGSGATPENAPSLARIASGIIVGSALKEGGSAEGRVDVARVRSFMAALGRS